MPADLSAEAAAQEETIVQAGLAKLLKNIVVRYSLTDHAWYEFDN